jgi:hypothetical protein
MQMAHTDFLAAACALIAASAPCSLTMLVVLGIPPGTTTRRHNAALDGAE